jgi:hypothetical protein
LESPELHDSTLNDRTSKHGAAVVLAGCGEPCRAVVWTRSLASMIKLGAFAVVLALAGCGGSVVVDSYDLNAGSGGAGGAGGAGDGGSGGGVTVEPPAGHTATMFCDPDEGCES